MEFAELSKLIFSEIKPKLESNLGLSIFARERAKFEGWMKVELCESLSKYFKDVVPEKHRIDITFEDWAIELKTVNTNIRYENVENKHRPITKNTKGVVDDIGKLRLVDYTNKAVLFVAFPIIHDNKHWQIQLQRISSLLAVIRHVEFSFNNGIHGVIYFGHI